MFQNTPSHAFEAIQIQDDDLTRCFYTDDDEIRAFMHADIVHVLTEDLVAWATDKAKWPAMHSQIQRTSGLEIRRVWCEAWTAPAFAIPASRAAGAIQGLRECDQVNIRRWVATTLMVSARAAGNVGALTFIDPITIKKERAMTGGRDQAGTNRAAPEKQGRDGKTWFSLESLEQALLKIDTKPEKVGPEIARCLDAVTSARKDDTGPDGTYLSAQGVLDLLSASPRPSFNNLRWRFYASGHKTILEPAAPGDVEIIPPGQESARRSAAGGAAKGAGLPELSFNGVTIRDQGEMLCLTDMWHAQGSVKNRDPAQWLRSADAKRFLDFVCLSKGLGSDMGNSHNALVSTTKGGESTGGGATYAHWQIGFAYAAWLAPAFRKWVNDVARDYMMSKLAPAPATQVITCPAWLTDMTKADFLRTIGGVVKQVMGRHSEAHEADLRATTETVRALDKSHQELREMVAALLPRVKTREEEVILAHDRLMTATEVILQAGYLPKRGLSGRLAKELRDFVDPLRFFRGTLKAHQPKTLRFFPEDVDLWLKTGGYDWLEREVGRSMTT